MKKFNKPIIVGNWKADIETIKQALSTIKNIDKILTSKKLKKVSYCLAVPEVFISSLTKISKYGLIGAQNITGTESGQQTGQTTPSMLLSSGANFTIIGHSEVRKVGETDEIISKKVISALEKKLPVILCIGEEKRDNEGKYISHLEGQLKKDLHLVKREMLTNLIIAYEPIWAIGARNSATVHECFETVIAIRRSLSSMFGIDYAKKVSILYGGAVDEKNSKNFMNDGGIDGLLVGRASQEAKKFSSILISLK